MTASLNKELILSRFEQWLDLALAAEEPPAGVDPEILAQLTSDPAAEPQADETSSYALWSAMTVLSQEVKLQGRSFKELSETLGSRDRDRDRDRDRETERKCRREILGALIDLRDRLERGIESARKCSSEMGKPRPKSWLERLVSKTPERNPAEESVAALIKGYELGLDRLDQTLADFNARQIPCLGQPFDPRLMNAIDKGESAGVAGGTVLEVYRSGYEWNGEVFRVAQVKVST